MPKPSHLAALVLPVLIATLLACTGEAPTPDPTETPTPTSVAVTAAPPTNTPTPVATPAPTPLPTPTPPGTTSLLPPTDQEAVLSSLSETELSCIGEDPEKMLAALTGGRPASMEEQTRLVGCLDDHSVTKLFTSMIIPIPLSDETSTCVLEGLDVIDPRAVMTAGLEGDPQTAMAGSMAAFSVSIACLNQAEWTGAAPKLGMEPEDRDGMVCVMAALGGPAEMATAMTEAIAAQEMPRESALYIAGLECGMEAPPEPAAPGTSDGNVHPDAHGDHGNTNAVSDAGEHPVHTGANDGDGAVNTSLDGRDHPGDHRRRDTGGDTGVRPG